MCRKHHLKSAGGPGSRCHTSTPSRFYEQIFILMPTFNANQSNTGELRHDQAQQDQTIFAKNPESTACTGAGPSSWLSNSCTATASPTPVIAPRSSCRHTVSQYLCKTRTAAHYRVGRQRHKAVNSYHPFVPDASHCVLH